MDKQELFAWLQNNVRVSIEASSECSGYGSDNKYHYITVRLHAIDPVSKQDIVISSDSCCVYT